MFPLFLFNTWQILNELNQDFKIKLKSMNRLIHYKVTCAITPLASNETKSGKNNQRHFKF